MDDSTLCSIGELARRTGLTVKTIRLYSDRGIVVPAGRTTAGYRRYAPESIARLALVRTLRELGLGLDEIRRVVNRERVLRDVAAEHAAALDVQIGILRLRRAVLTAVAERGPTPEETELMHRLATLSEAERRRLIDDFLAAVFEGLDPASPHAAARHSMTPALPDNPTEAQIKAWVELAELSLDPDFRAVVRRLAEDHAAARSEGGTPTPPRPDAVAIVRDLVRPALEYGISPDSPQADPVVAAVTAHCARARQRPEDAELHRWLLRRLEAAGDPRWDRYFRLLARINDWPAPEPLGPVIAWSVTALRARAAR